MKIRAIVWDMARYCELRRTGIEVDNESMPLFGGHNAIARRMCEIEEIRELVELSDSDFDMWETGNDGLRIVNYWSLLRDQPWLVKNVVYGVHKIRDRSRTHAKKEVERQRSDRVVEYSRVREQLKRAASRGSEATLTIDEWIRIMEAFLGECAYCSSDASIGMDHIVPISKGGGTTRTNVVPCCFFCNSTKRDKNAEDFAGRNAVDAIRVKLEGIDHD